MQSFRDTSGRSWVLSVTAGSIKRVKALAGVQLAGLAEDNFKGLVELIGTDELFPNVLFALVQPQAEKLGVSQTEFDEAMDLDCLREAGLAFLEVYASFFPKQTRETYRRVMRQAVTHMEAALEQAARQAAALSLPRESGGPSGSVPGASGSIPTPSLSPN